MRETKREREGERERERERKFHPVEKERMRKEINDI